MIPCTCAFFITSRLVLGRSAYLSCSCKHGPSRGWSVRRILLPYVYTCLLLSLAYAQRFLKFYKAHIPKSWIFSLTGFSSMSDMGSLLKALLLGVLLGVKNIWCFWRGFLNGLVNLRSFPRDVVVLIHISYRQCPLLFSGFRFSKPLFSGGSCGLFGPLVPCFIGGSLKFLDVLLRKCEWRPGNYSLWILFFSWRIRAQISILPFYQTAFIL